MGMQLCAWCIVSYSNVNCNYRKAKLPVEMELEGSSIPDGSEMAEDDLPVLEKKMKQMMKFKEHLFKDAKANSLATNKTMTTNEDYDRKRSASEVFVDCIHNKILLRCSCEIIYVI